MHHMFSDNALVDTLNSCEQLNIFADVLDLESCQTGIKPTTFFLGHIKRSNQKYYDEMQNISFKEFM